MDWSYIGGFFDGEGNINLNKITNKEGKLIAYQLAIRFYNSDLETLNKIKEFIGCGNIYKSKANHVDRSLMYELNICKKAETKAILSNLSNFCLSKKNKIDYLIKNFNFNYNSNIAFNIEEFHSLTLRKNVANFYVKKEPKINPVTSCSICGEPFTYSFRRIACSSECINKAKENRFTE